MKIRTRLAIAFLTITVLPITLIYLAIMSLYDYQGKMFSETYGLEEQVDLASGASIRVFSRLTESIQMEIDQVLKNEPEKFHDRTYLDRMNTSLSKAHSFLIILDEQELIYTGNPETTHALASEIRNFEDLGSTASWGNYLDDDTEHLIKQRGFRFADDSEGTILLVTNVVEVIPEVKSMFLEMLIASGIILVLTAAIMVAWVYRSIWKPIGQLQEATKQIRDGNLDFTLDVEDDDEIGQLCQNFEEMRIRLKETTEEKIQYDKESKELISNISHDLKTPITAIRGYAEGILDGVASSPEKLERYIRTIYNKANDMDRLIAELTFYSKIDTNKIPYAFAKINVADYFGDCIDEVGLDLEARGVELGYFNYVDEDVLVIADAEQIKRVVDNIIGNSLKYMDKKKGRINIRILDVGDFVQVEIEDNGKGIGQKELPYIFDRFYRTDSSRNSATGGSGIGLSIVKKIIEDHGGKIWATSKLGIGTEIHFVLRKIHA
ncbi:MAG: HAMP domain-containing histidine kinase [Lachnospiraceae bacterium]|nr:HAMP domain-containing histidine kinase [Lachnospiraceae bacterium]